MVNIVPIHTHYDNLKVAHNAPSEVIRAAYRVLAQRYHPDLNRSPDAARVMKLLNEAYAVLSDPIQRAAHDAWIEDQLASESIEQAAAQTRQQAAERQQASPQASAHTKRAPPFRTANLARVTLLMRHATRFMQFGVASIPVVLIAAWLWDSRPRSVEPSAPTAASRPPVLAAPAPAEPARTIANNVIAEPPAPVVGKRWSDIARSANFSSLSELEKDSVREAYFERVVAPKVRPADIPAARAQFYRESGHSSRTTASDNHRATPRLIEFNGTLDEPIKPGVANPSFHAVRWSPNGQPWPMTASYIKGNGIRQRAFEGLSTLTIDNTNGGANVYVKLCRASMDRCDGLRHVFIPLGSSFTMSSVSPGAYDIRYRALDTGALSKSEVINLAQVETERGTRYTTMRLTLYRVAGGNTSFESLPEDKF
jgi:curved DNA-binding protein CbpA